MRNGPDIARLAALIGDPARASMLCALSSGMALTAGELATEAGVTPQTASGHLAQLAAAGIVAVEAQGRHRYVRLAGAEVAELLEGLMGLAVRTGPSRARVGPREPEMRRARICYDHLAGGLAVDLLEGLVRERRLAMVDGGISVTEEGARFFCGLGIDLAGLRKARRPVCRPCLDWSERRPHLAGGLGAALLRHFEAEGWARRSAASRVVTVTPRGRQALRAVFGLAA